MIAQGAEAKVYYADGNTSVVKERTSIYSTWQKALDAIALHNCLFPETPMTVIGFTRDSDGLMRIVLTQPYVNCERLATKNEIDEMVMAKVQSLLVDKKIKLNRIMGKKVNLFKNCMFLLLLSLSMSIYAQNGQVSERRITTKYEEFISQSGTFIKFTDILLPPIDQYHTDGISGVVRTVWGQDKNYYFLILTKSSLFEGPRAMIEYSDLLELNKAFARLLNEVDEDVRLRTEYNYLENKYVTNDHFKLGYYIEKKKAKWFVQFDPYTEVTRISYQEDLCQLLQNAQESIEKIMAREGK